MATVIWALMPTAMGFAREIVRGLSERVKREGHETVLRVADIGWHGNVPSLHGDAFISLAAAPQTLRELRRGGAAVVNVSSRDPRLTHEFPSVVPDNIAAGRLAAEHLMLQGYRTFASFNVGQFSYASERVAGFCRALAEAELAVEEIETAGIASADRPSLLQTWLGRREEPVGILAVDDSRAGEIIEACHACHRAIPNQVGVIGVNNDEMLCETADPPLSSVDLNARRIGQEAIDLVLALLRGEPAPQQPIIVPPSGIAMRGSTRAVVARDPTVHAAIELMLSHMSAPFTIESLADEIGVSKRKLERTFVDALGCSPAEHYRALRLSRVAELLRETDMPLQQVAQKTGFASYQHFCNLFKRRYGVRPSEYRDGRPLR